MNGSEAERIAGQFMPTQEAAKVMIKDYFEQHHGELIDYVDLVRALDSPLPIIEDACEELEKEGKIAGVDEQEKASHSLGAGGRHSGRSDPCGMSEARQVANRPRNGSAPLLHHRCEQKRLCRSGDAVHESKGLIHPGRG